MESRPRSCLKFYTAYPFFMPAGLVPPNFNFRKTRFVYFAFRVFGHFITTCGAVAVTMVACISFEYRKAQGPVQISTDPLSRRTCERLEEASRCWEWNLVEDDSVSTLTCLNFYTAHSFFMPAGLAPPNFNFRKTRFAHFAPSFRKTLLNDMQSCRCSCDHGGMHLVGVQKKAHDPVQNSTDPLSRRTCKRLEEASGCWEWNLVEDDPMAAATSTLPLHS